MRKRVIALMMTAATLFGTAYAQDLVVALTFDGGGWFDRSFNEGTWTGLTSAVQDLAGETAVDVLIYNGSADTTVTALRRMAATRLDLVVAAGYAGQSFIDQRLARNRSSYAFVTDPIPAAQRSPVPRPRSGSTTTGASELSASSSASSPLAWGEVSTVTCNGYVALLPP